MNYKSFSLGDWIGHISGVIEDYSELDGNEMRDLVEFLTTLNQELKTGWIPVSEKLPEEFQRVLVTIVNYKGDKIVRVAEYYNYNNNNRKGIFHINETHEQWEVGEKGLLAWLPLPKPYEPQESEVNNG